MNGFSKRAPYYVLGGFAAFILCWFRIYFTAENIAAVDLPSHLVQARNLRYQLLHFRLTFYDHTTFTGFPELRFYGFFPALCSALLSYPLGLFFPDPVVPASHVLLVIGMALFPFTFFYALRPLAVEVSGSEDNFERNGWVTAILAGTFSFWFLNHDKQWYGIGAAAPMNIGLFAQLFGWHVFLLYTGLIVRLQLHPSRRNTALLAISYALLPICHTMTFVFATVLGGYFVLFYGGARAKLIVAHIVGFCLCGFWFIPALGLLGKYTAFDIYRPTGDFLEILFRYPWYGLFRTVHTWLGGEFALLDPIHILQPILILLLFAHPRIPKTGYTFALALFTLACVVIFSSGFVASSLPLGIHYYRFIAYEFLLFALLTCITPLAVIPEKHGTVVRIGISLAAILCFSALVNLPHYERKKIATHTGLEYLKDEREVIDYFQSLPDKGRVYIEYLTNYDKFPPLSAHYISSRLYLETGFEAVVNSHLQESMAYRMLVVSAKLLGAKTYNVPLLFTDEAELSDSVLVQQLRDFGVTHVICGRKEFCDKLGKQVLAPPKQIGPYKIFQLKAGGVDRIDPVRKELVGYLDLKGNMPFNLVEYFFYAKERYYNRFEVIELSENSPIPEQLSLVMVNAESRDNRFGSIERRAGKVPAARLDFNRHYLLDHYEPHYPYNMELDHYKEVEKYLRTFMPFDLLFRESVQTARAQNSAQLTWSEDGQSFTAAPLTPGEVYRINYAYFPYWKAEGGQLYRGSDERMYLFADQQNVRASYSAWMDYRSWVGLFCSLAASAMIFIWLRKLDSTSENS